MDVPERPEGSSAGAPLPPQPGGGPTRKTRLPLLVRIILIAAAVLVVGIIVLAASPSNRWFWRMTFGSGSYPMSYQVTGSARSASVRYTTPDGHVVEQDVTLPWTLPFLGSRKDDLRLEAIAGDDGSITCRIKFDGHTIRFNAVTGGSPSACSVA